MLRTKLFCLLKEGTLGNSTVPIGSCRVFAGEHRPFRSGLTLQKLIVPALADAATGTNWRYMLKFVAETPGVASTIAIAGPVSAAIPAGTAALLTTSRSKDVKKKNLSFPFQV